MQMYRERRNCGTRFPHVVNVHDAHTRKYCYVEMSLILLRQLVSVVRGQVFGFHQHIINMPAKGSICTASTIDNRS